MHAHRFVRVVGAGLTAALVAILPLAASAHEHREVAGGQFELGVGFLDEPAFVGLKNGLELDVSRTAAASPEAAAGDEDADAAGVEGLSGSLQAQVLFGGETMDLPLEPRFGEAGGYRAVFFPMAEGDYTFRVFGEIEGNVIDESFTSGPQTFSSVEPIEPLQFPKGQAGTGETIAASIGGAPAIGGLGGGSDEGGFGGPGGGLLAGLAGATAAAGLWFGRRGRPARAASPLPVRA